MNVSSLLRYIAFSLSSYQTMNHMHLTRVNRAILSIGQDVCRAVCNGEWKLPKHVLLCVTLLRLLNRLGHCENDTFAAEIEVAMTKTLDETSSHLTNGIVNKVFHSEWDDFNQRLSGIHRNSSVIWLVS